jgi:ribosomal protein S18 acetylase RimI-like enzyme
VGAISCRYWPREIEVKTVTKNGQTEEIDEPKDDRRCLYIIILSVLDEYRRFGIASQLLEEAIRRAKEDHPDLYSVYLHTPIGNKAAIQFYEKNGFKQKETVSEYYKSMENSDEKDAVLLELDIAETSA